MTAMVTISNISMVKLGGLLGEVMAALQPRVTLQWTDGVAPILTQMDGQTLQLIGWQVRAD
tara:strand:- start:415 stop:597 length:183 start_codon:yes stop_codon:yes gene_type:complete